MSRNSIDMTSGNAWEQMVAFAIPILLGELFQQSYSIIDSAIVGNFVGNDALAAVGASETITRVVVGFFSGVSVGCTVIAARAFGRKDEDELKSAVHTIVWLSVLIGAGLSLIDLSLRLMEVPAEALPMARRYLLIYFSGICGLVLYNTVSGILRAVGNSRRPLYFLIFSSVLNTTLDVLFVAVFDWGVTGAASATILAQFISAALSLRLLMCTDRPWRFEWKGRLDRAAAKAIMTTGFPIGLQKSIVSLSNVIVLSYITYFGTACMAGWVVYTKMSHTLTMVAQSFTSAETTFISQNLGSEQPERAKKGIQITLLLSFGIEGALILLTLLFRRPLIALFGDSQSMMEFAENFVLWLIPFQAAHIMMSVYIAVLRGTGRAAIGTVFMIVGLVAVRQIYLAAITGVVNTPVIVGLAYPLGWVASGALVYSFYFFKMKRKLAFHGI